MAFVAIGRGGETNCDPPERRAGDCSRVSECSVRARGQVDNALDTSPCRKVADNFLL